MIQNCVIKSFYNNYYFYDKSKGIHHCHPVFAYIISNPNLEYKDYLESNPSAEVDVSLFKYFKLKYDSFKNDGYFTSNTTTVDLTKELNEDIVVNSIANMRQITFELTDNCSLACEYCIYSSLYDKHELRKSKSMDFKIAKKLIDYLLNYWNSNLNNSKNKNIYLSFYGGEPLLNFELIRQIVDYSKSIRLSKNYFSYNMTTNGLLLSKYIDYFVDNNFNILISLDGDRYNNSYRKLKNGGESYDLVLKEIEIVKEKFPLYFEKNINFNAVLHNKNSVDDIYHYFKSNFNKIPSIGELNFDGISPEMENKFNDMYQNSFRSYHKSQNMDILNKEMFIKLPVIQSVSNFIMAYSGSTYKSYNSLLAHDINARRFPTGTCIPFSKKMFVTVNGKLLPCETIGHEHALGEVTEHEVRINYSEIAEKYNSYFRSIIKKCSSCNINDNCTQCVLFDFELTKLNFSCKNYMNDNEFMKFLIDHISFLEKYPELYPELIENVITI